MYIYSASNVGWRKQGDEGQVWDLGLWDYTLFEIRKLEISFEIGIMDLKSDQIWIFHPCKLGLHPISPYLKFGLWDYTSFEIGIMALQNPLWGPFSRMLCTYWVQIELETKLQ